MIETPDPESESTSHSVLSRTRVSSGLKECAVVLFPELSDLAAQRLPTLPPCLAAMGDTSDALTETGGKWVSGVSR